MDTGVYQNHTTGSLARPNEDSEQGFIRKQGDCSLCLSRSIKSLYYAFLSSLGLCLLTSTHSLSKYLLSTSHGLGQFQVLGIEKRLKQTKIHIQFLQVYMSLKFQGLILFGFPLSISQF
jgi:hypothetical protein